MPAKKVTIKPVVIPPIPNTTAQSEPEKPVVIEPIIDAPKRVDIPSDGGKVGEVLSGESGHSVEKITAASPRTENALQPNAEKRGGEVPGMAKQGKAKKVTIDESKNKIIHDKNDRPFEDPGMPNIMEQFFLNPQGPEPAKPKKSSKDLTQGPKNLPQNAFAYTNENLKKGLRDQDKVCFIRVMV